MSEDVRHKWAVGQYVEIYSVVYVVHWLFGSGYALRNAGGILQVKFAEEHFMFKAHPAREALCRFQMGLLSEAELDEIESHYGVACEVVY